MSALCYGGTSPQELRSGATAIRLFGEPARKMLLERRAEQRARVAAYQQRWQHKVPRRPQRGNHHDSWAIRESYVRGGGSYIAYYATGHDLIHRRVGSGATRLGQHIGSWLAEEIKRGAKS